MQISMLQIQEGERLRAGAALVRHIIEEMSGLERVLARRETSFGAAIERDLFPDGVPPRVLPSDLRHALAARLDGALRTWTQSPPDARDDPWADVLAPLRAIAASVRAGEDDDDLHDLLFPGGIPAQVSATHLLRAFRVAASREQRLLSRVISLVPAFEQWEALIEHEIAGRLVLVTRLWVVAVRWYALAAGRAGESHARAFEELLTKWQQIERTTRQLIDA